MAIKGTIFNLLTYSADSYIMALSVNGVPYPLWLIEEVGYSSKKNTTYIYPMGSTEPIGIVPSESKYSGKISVEASILQTIMQINGYVVPTQIQNATFSIATYAGALVKVFSGVYITSADMDIKAKGKRSLVTLNFDAIEVSGI